MSIRNNRNSLSNERFQQLHALLNKGFVNFLDNQLVGRFVLNETKAFENHFTAVDLAYSLLESLVLQIDLLVFWVIKVFQYVACVDRASLEAGFGYSRLPIFSVKSSHSFDAVLYLIHSRASNFLLLLLQELGLIEWDASTLTSIPFELDLHLSLGIQELLLLLLPLLISQHLLSFLRFSLGLGQLLITLHSCYLSFPSILLIFYFPTFSGFFNLLLSQSNTFLFGEVALIFFFEFTFAFLFDNKELLIQVSIICVLLEPAQSTLKGLAILLSHEQGFLRCVFREAHLLKLLNHILFDVRSDGSALILLFNLLSCLLILLSL